MFEASLGSLSLDHLEFRVLVLKAFESCLAPTSSIVPETGRP